MRNPVKAGKEGESTMKPKIKRKVVAPFDITKLKRCPYCGSTDIDEIDDGLWYCNYCWQKWGDEGLVEEEQMVTKEAQELAKPCYEAIKKIAEKTGRKCVQCHGDGVIYETPLSGESKCFVCNGTGKVKGKWEWEPEVGESFVGSEGVPIVIAGIIDVPLALGTENRRLQHLSLGKVKEVFVKDTIPLLHWEKLEEILKEMGYIINLQYNPKVAWWCEIWRNELLLEKVDACQTRQEAVQRAVIELGKEE